MGMNKQMVSSNSRSEDKRHHLFSLPVRHATYIENRKSKQRVEYSHAATASFKQLFLIVAIGDGARRWMRDSYA